MEASVPIFLLLLLIWQVAANGCTAPDTKPLHKTLPSPCVQLPSTVAPSQPLVHITAA